MSKARYIAKISYSEKFKPTIDLFNELIKVDPRVKERIPEIGEQRFSAVMRDLIDWYVKKRLPHVLPQHKSNQTISQPQQSK